MHLCINTAWDRCPATRRFLARRNNKGFYQSASSSMTPETRDAGNLQSRALGILRAVPSVASVRTRHCASAIRARPKQHSLSADSRRRLSVKTLACHNTDIVTKTDQACIRRSACTGRNGPVLGFIWTHRYGPLPLSRNHLACS